MCGIRANAMADPIEWNERYRRGYRPWDTGRPSAELRRVVDQHGVPPCRTLELGCGAGTDSVWLAEQGFEVTSVDVSPLAVKRAHKHARAAGVNVHFVVADVFELPDLGGPFAFFFDGGCYHAVRRDAPQQYAPAVARQLAPGARGLILAGHALKKPSVSEKQIRDELGSMFQILDLHKFRPDEGPGAPAPVPAWSCLVEKR
jgi:SAM-dependent methyltransferase